ncbi:hypothetical protein [Thiolinea disciformis]|uniref:hypothetical protein n=1 Tax=Thiolinea disciformis TaxID=125614 RepID=UPI00036CF9B2|nr:hypothetical protein [Thiolinea disciformis]
MTDCQRLAIKRSELITDLQRIMNSERHRLADKSWDLAIDAALVDLSKGDARPITLQATLTLVSGQAQYPAPPFAARYLGTDWGLQATQPLWDMDYEPPARVQMTKIMGKRVLHFSPAPSFRMIAVHGDQFEFYYGENHVLTEQTCTVLPSDWELLKVRALASLMTELIAAHVVAPVTINRGMTPATYTKPQDAFNALMGEFERLKRAH